MLRALLRCTQRQLRGAGDDELMNPALPLGPSCLGSGFWLWAIHAGALIPEMNPAADEFCQRDWPGNRDGQEEPAPGPHDRQKKQPTGPRSSEQAQANKLET